MFVLMHLYLMLIFCNLTLDLLYIFICLGIVNGFTTTSITVLLDTATALCAKGFSWTECTYVNIPRIYSQTHS